MEVGPSAAPMIPIEAASVYAEEHGRNAEGEKDTELRRRSEEHQLGVGKDRRKVDHGSDSDKQNQREQLVRDSGVKQGAERSRLPCHSVHDLRNGARQRNVDKNGAKAERQKQSRLHVLLDGKKDQQTADQPHHNVLPGDVQKILIQNTQFFSPDFY